MPGFPRGAPCRTDKTNKPNPHHDAKGTLRAPDPSALDGIVFERHGELWVVAGPRSECTSRTPRHAESRRLVAEPGSPLMSWISRLR